MSAPWLSVAVAEVGVEQFRGRRSNPRITEYHVGTNIRGYDDKAPWCSSFVNWCLTQAGIAGTGSALARSWLDWGETLDAPQAGCITVLSRDSPTGGKGHVGFYLRSDEEAVYLLGGNQLGGVHIQPYPLRSVLGYRWPTAVPHASHPGTSDASQAGGDAENDADSDDESDAGSGGRLREISDVRQIDGEPARAWYFCHEQDLVVWFDAAGTPCAFQLAYNKYRDERSVAWHHERGYRHYAVTEGIRSGTPLLHDDGLFDRDAVLGRFQALAADLPPAVVQLVEEKLRAFSGRSDS